MDGRSDLKPSIGRQKRFANSGRYMARQPFVDRLHIVFAGAFTGVWAAPRFPESAGRPAGGRRAYGHPHAVCAPDRLTQMAGTYGCRSKVPTAWIHSPNSRAFS
jgi:hypothetical protein